VTLGRGRGRAVAGAAAVASVNVTSTTMRTGLLDVMARSLSARIDPASVYVTAVRAAVRAKRDRRAIPN